MTRSLLAWVLLGSLAAVGCGDDDDDASGAGGGGAAAGQGGSAGSAGASAAGQGGAAGTSSGGSGQAGAAGASPGGSGQSGASGQAGQGGEAGQGGAAAGAGAGQGGGAGASSSGRWLMGYYPGYQTGDLPVADVRFDLMTQVAVGAVLPRADGSLDASFYKDDVAGPAFAKDLASRARQAGKKAVLMVGGAGAHDGFVGAASDASRATFVASLVAFAQDSGFDGIDLDWEPLPPAELDSFLALASALRAAWPGALLTLPVNPINPNVETVDPRFAAISQAVDQLNVMSYSMSGAYDGWKSWHHSPLAGQTPATPTSISTSVDAYLAAGVPAAKLGIGEGFYGLCYTSPVTGPRQDLGGATSSADDNQLSYRAILSTYLPSATRKWDDDASSPYLVFAQPTGPLGCTYLSYTDEQSIAAHTDYVKQKGLGGAIVWTVNEGHVPTAPAGERDPLLAALWSGLK